MRLSRGKTASHFPDHALALLALLGEAFEQPLDLAALLALAVSPFADHLLLGAHMRHQSLDGFGEVGHRRGVAAAAAFFYCRAELVERRGEIAGHPLAAILAHRGGEPVFEVGVEAVLRLARLQIEKAED